MQRDSDEKKERVVVSEQHADRVPCSAHSGCSVRCSDVYRVACSGAAQDDLRAVQDAVHAQDACAGSGAAEP